MKISVCMGTYNGAKYIQEQLYSILEQTRKVDEVILCDDGSTDGTVEIIQNFISNNGREDSWKLYQNEQNKGYPANFYYACSLCTGDVVFLADQDDIWTAEKIKRMSDALEKENEMKVIACKFGLIDAQGNDIHTLMAPTHNLGTGNLRQVTIGDVFYKCEWPGMVMAYKREWYESWSKGNYQIPHDFLICARAAEEGAFYQMDAELAYHRRHDNNTGGEEHHLNRLLNKQRKLKEIKTYLDILNAFEAEQPLQTEEGKTELQKKKNSMQDRYDALLSGKVSRVLQNAFQNWRNVRLATLVCDVLIVKQK